MYLINTTTLELRPFLGILPPYVILSHTWGDDEVTFERMQKPDTLDTLTKGSYGYRKIKQCCRQAKKDGYKWAWVDTCCIDKRSSAELSEAINSMYRYYWEADKCYAYLSDVCIKHEPSTTRYMPSCDATERLQVPTGNRHDISILSPESTVRLLSGSRWFKRGWTLQELLAPAVVEFYDIHWTRLGTKSNLATEIGKITEINVRYLYDRASIKTASIGLRLSWASNRQTTRDEDIAYCLLGIVGVNMPLLYGEGRRAFRRLQIELLKKTRDHTMFSWSNFAVEPGLSSLTQGSQSFLSPSPTYFRAFMLENVRPTFLQPLAESRVLEMTPLGLHITLPCIEGFFHGHTVAILDCLKENNTRIGIVLLEWSDGRYQRSKYPLLPGVSPEQVRRAVTKELYIADQDLEELENKISSWCRFKVDRLIMEGIPESHVRGYMVHYYPGSSIRTYQNARDFCNKVAELGRHQAIGYIIKLRSATIAVLIADFNGHSWLRVVPSEDGLAKAEVEELIEEFSLGPKSDHLRDSVTASIGTELQVDVHARRNLLRLEDDVLPCWQLSIHIRAGYAMPLR